MHGTLNTKFNNGHWYFMVFASLLLKIIPNSRYTHNKKNKRRCSLYLQYMLAMALMFV